MRHIKIIDGLTISGTNRVFEGSHMTMIKALGLAFSMLLMSLALIDPTVLSTPAGY